MKFKPDSFENGASLLKSHRRVFQSKEDRKLRRRTTTVTTAPPPPTATTAATSEASTTKDDSLSHNIGDCCSQKSGCKCATKRHFTRNMYFIGDKADDNKRIEETDKEQQGYHRVHFQMPFVRLKEVLIPDGRESFSWPKPTGKELKRCGEIEDNSNCGVKESSTLSAAKPEEEERSKTSDYFRAEAKKLDGNILYGKGQYSDALKCYTQAIRLKPNNPYYYGNRSACYVMLGNHKSALEDARHAVQLDAGFTKGYLRQIKCLLALGEWESAQSVIDKVKALDHQNVDLEENEQNVEIGFKLCRKLKELMSQNMFDEAVTIAKQVLRLSPQSTWAKLKEAEAMVYLSQYSEAFKTAGEILKVDPTNADAIYVKGLTLYYQGQLDYALIHFQKALRFEPEHFKAKESRKKAKLLKATKDEANKAFAANDMDKAFQLYTEALTVDSKNACINSKLHFNRSIVHQKRNNYKDALSECTKAISLDGEYEKAYMKRANLHMQLEMFSKAVKDYEILCKKFGRSEFQTLLNQAKSALVNGKKSYYKTLGVPVTATEEEIKKAYKRLALVHHPDRHSNATDIVKTEHEKKFKEILEAYGVLSDSQKRSAYDRTQNASSQIYPQYEQKFHGAKYTFFSSSNDGVNSYSFYFP